MPIRVLDDKSYDNLLNLVFPVPPEVKKGVLFTMSLRIMTFSEPEAQIQVTFFESKPPSVTYSVADGYLWGRAIELMCADESTGVPQMAKRISVKNHVFEVASGRALGWQNEMLASIRGTFQSLQKDTEDRYRGASVGIVLDGTQYEVRYDGGNGQFTGRFSQTADGPAVARWAESLRAEVEKEKGR